MPFYFVKILLGNSKLTLIIQTKCEKSKTVSNFCQYYSVCCPTCNTFDRSSAWKIYWFEICLAYLRSCLTLTTLSELVAAKTNELLLFSNQRTVLYSAADFFDKRTVQPQIVNNLRQPNHLFSLVMLYLEASLEVCTRSPAVSQSLGAHRYAMPSSRGYLFNLNVA